MSIQSYLHLTQEINPLAVKWISIITGIIRLPHLIHKHQLAVAEAEWWLLFQLLDILGKTLK